MATQPVAERVSMYELANRQDRRLGATLPFADAHYDDHFVGSYPYRSVQALALSFEDDDMNVAGEIQDLCDVLTLDYGFETRGYSIPSHRPTTSVTKFLGSFMNSHGQSRDTLVVIFVACHGTIKEGELVLGRQVPTLRTLC
jgi:hypothetical protein